MTIERLRTIADYHDYVERLSPDEPTPELMNGRFVITARPAIEHVRYFRFILKAIEAYVDTHQLKGEILPEFEAALDEYTVAIPDIAYLVEDSSSGRLDRKRIYGAPDFVCEIASPSTRVYDAHEKFLAYFCAGVREYWLVDPFADPGGRFTLYERVEKVTTSTMPTFQQIDGGPAQSRLFPGIALPQELL